MMWNQIAEWFEIKADPFDGVARPLAKQWDDCAAVWASIASRHKLAEIDINQLPSQWRTGAELGSPSKVVTKMSKSRRGGCLDYQLRTIRSMVCSKNFGEIG